MPFMMTTAEGKADVRIRAVLATMFAIGVVAGFFIGKISPEVFTTFATMAISWYFAKRDEDEKKA